jgi:hypothetical protein
MNGGEPMFQNAVIMNRGLTTNWNTIMTPFSWRELASAPGGGNADVALAGKILTNLMPINCLAGTPTSIEMEVDTRVPITSQLMGFSNPYRILSKLRYQVGSSEDIMLAIYDVGGRRVRTLIEGLRSRGSHETWWDGRDDNGSEVSSGLYILVFGSAESTSSHKFVLLR